MKRGVKHLVQCHCILPQYKKQKNPIFHKFPVFSIVEGDSIKEKYVLCNNCDIVHRVYETNKSEIKWGNESYNSLVTTKEDIKFNLENQGMERLVSILEVNNIDVSDWELIDYLIENNLQGNVVINKKEIDNSINYKYLEIKDGKYKIKNEVIQRYL